jgi:hypothetical protein
VQDHLAAIRGEHLVDARFPGKGLDSEHRTVVVGDNDLLTGLLDLAKDLQHMGF